MRKIILKNNIIANINVSLNDNINAIHAHDERGNLVGFCHFKIFHVYSRSTTENFRKMYAKKYGLNLCEVPLKHDFKINVNDKDKYSLINSIITLSTGKSYDLEYTYCEIGEIEIVDEKYYKIGLGKAMLEETEKVAKTYNCLKIKGKYLPKGNFQFGTQQFYKRNGFMFEKEDNETFVVKSLEKNMVIQSD